MGKPEDIPQDAWDAAFDPGENAYMALKWMDAQAIVARAIMAERDRCARIAFCAYDRKTEICSRIIRKIRTGVER